MSATTAKTVSVVGIDIEKIGELLHSSPQLRFMRTEILRCFGK